MQWRLREKVVWLENLIAAPNFIAERTRLQLKPQPEHGTFRDVAQQTGAVGDIEDG